MFILFTIDKPARVLVPNGPSGHSGGGGTSGTDIEGRPFKGRTFWASVCIIPLMSYPPSLSVRISLYPSILHSA